MVVIVVWYLDLGRKLIDVGISFLMVMMSCMYVDKLWECGSVWKENVMKEIWIVRF